MSFETILLLLVVLFCPLMMFWMHRPEKKSGGSTEGKEKGGCH